MRRFICFLLLGAFLAVPVRGIEPVITRGEFLILLWEDSGGIPYDITAHPFTDLTGRDDLAQAAGWAWELGLIKGIGDGLFAPDRSLTREECAVLLRRFDAIWGREDDLPDLAICNDNENASPWAGDALYRACAAGRLPWKRGRLAPLEPVKAGEALACLAWR